MPSPIIGEIRAFAFSYYPADTNWLPCNGQLVSASQYPQLFELIGTTYGGGGGQFALPNLNRMGQVGLALVGAGQGAGSGFNYTVGQQNGVNAVTLTNAQTAHNHAITAINSTTPSGSPTANSYLSRYVAGGNVDAAYSDQPTSGTLAAATLGPSAGSRQPHDNMQPYLGFIFAIAVASNPF